VIELAAYTTYVPYNATISYNDSTTTLSTNENEIVKALSDNRYYFIGAGLVLISLLMIGVYFMSVQRRIKVRERPQESSSTEESAKHLPRRKFRKLDEEGVERDLSVHDIYVTKNSPGMTPGMTWAVHVGRQDSPVCASLGGRRDLEVSPSFPSDSLEGIGGIEDGQFYDNSDMQATLRHIETSQKKNKKRFGAVGYMGVGTHKYGEESVDEAYTGEAVISMSRSSGSPVVHREGEEQEENTRFA
jgi:hypothetical protein